MATSIDEIFQINRILKRGYSAEGSARALTDSEFFQISWEMGANQLDPHYRNLFSGLAQWIKTELSPHTALEIGCGPGYLLHCLNQLEVKAVGIDGNSYSRDFFVAQHPQWASQYILDKTFEHTYAPTDALISIECFEHIPDKGLAKTMQKVATILNPKYIVFSSTPHADSHLGWDVMWGHINLKTESQWIELFAQYGYELVPGVRPPITPWALLFQSRTSKKDHPYQAKHSKFVGNLKRGLSRLKRKLLLP